MQNYPFITQVAKTGKPILLKRHYGASLRDFLGAAEYILYEGNKKLILCERVYQFRIHIEALLGSLRFTNHSCM